MRFEIDWASLIVGSKFTVYHLAHGGRGGSYFDGLFNGGFFALRGWGAYIWRGLFSEFYGTLNTIKNSLVSFFK